MPTYIGSFEHGGKRYFVEHSTIVDAPISPALLLEEFQEHYCRQSSETREETLSRLAPRIERAIAKGTSSRLDESFESMILCNRAGDKEENLTIDEYKALVLKLREEE